MRSYPLTPPPLEDTKNQTGIELTRVLITSLLSITPALHHTLSFLSSLSMHLSVYMAITSSSPLTQTDFWSGFNTRAGPDPVGAIQQLVRLRLFPAVFTAPPPAAAALGEEYGGPCASVMASVHRIMLSEQLKVRVSAGGLYTAGCIGSKPFSCHSMYIYTVVSQIL